jgi:N-acetylglutamate synthase-like GNAT family acetyltransferase
MQISYFIKLSSIYLAVLDLTKIDLDLYEINRINIPEKYRNQGFGRTLLQSACNDADLENVTLRLGVNPYGKMTYNQLKSWYLKFNFKEFGNDEGYLIRFPIKNNTLSAKVDQALS